MTNVSTMSLAFIHGLGTPEIILILLVILLLFGAKRLPELARGVGKSFKEFKRGLRNAEDDIRDAIDDEEKKNESPRKLNGNDSSSEEKKND